MATNPMQRKARNSFLLGMLLMLLISGLIIALLFLLLMNTQKEKKELEALYTSVYVLNKDVSSGSEITESDLTSVKALKTSVPTNPITPASLGTEGATIAKINLTSGTVVSADMLYIDGTTSGDDVRKQEYNTVVLPMDLVTDEYVDIRLLLPTGQDYIVVSKKQVEIPQVAGVDSTNTICMNLSESEILTMSNAIVEAFMINGAKLYATKYTEAGNQEAATPTYAVNGEVFNLIRNNPNIVDQAKSELYNRYNNEFRNNYINDAIGRQDDALANAEAGMTQSITNSQESREQYLQSLSAGY